MGGAPPALLVMLASYAVRALDTVAAGNVIFGALVYGLCWGTGRVLRRYSITQRALTRALDQLGREQEQRELLAVMAERARLARELHDVVAHAVALMVVQAGAARLALDDHVDTAQMTPPTPSPAAPGNTPTPPERPRRSPVQAR